MLDQALIIDNVSMIFEQTQSARTTRGTLGMTKQHSQYWKAGGRNLITDIPGLKVGNAQDDQIKTGATVLTADRPFVATVDVMGGAPGTRETDCLAPDRLVQQVNALVLSGGSAFGLDAASGVMQAMREQGEGFDVGPVKVPIVPAAIIFDLLNGGDIDWPGNPYPELGKSALESSQDHFELGTVGAGTGATTAALKGGLGSASLIMPDGAIVGALVVANPHGHVVVPGTRHFWAAPFEINGEFGDLGSAGAYDPTRIAHNEKLQAYQVKTNQQSSGKDTTGKDTTAGMNTTIAVVATDVSLDKSQLKRLAVASQDGMARAIVPSHTAFDGDLVFALSTGCRQLESGTSDPSLLGHAAAVCLSRAIARAVYHARPEPGDTLPSWSELE